MINNEATLAFGRSNVIRKLRKKLRQIEKLERLRRELSLDEEEKVDAKDSLRSELQQLLKEQEETMVALSKDVLNTSVKDGGVKKKVQSMMEFDHKVVNGHENGAANINIDDKLSADKTEINGVHEINLEHEDNGTEETVVAAETTQDEVTKETETSKIVASKPEVSLTITRKSLRERKPRSASDDAKRKQNDVSTPEGLFQELSLKMGLLEGHHDDACSVDLYGNFVVSGSRDTSLKLWIASSREELKSLGGHDAAITGVRFMKDKQFSTYPNAVSASYDCSLRVWNLEKGNTTKSIYVFSPVVCLDYSNGVAAIGTEGGKVELYDVDSGEQLFTVKAHEDAVSAVKMLSDGKIASGSSDGVIKIFEPKSGDVPIFTLDPTTIKIKPSVETCDDSTVAPAILNMSKVNCITAWHDYVIYGDDGYNLKVLDYPKGEIVKLRNNLNEFSPTEAMSIGEVQGKTFLFSVGSDVDNGDGYINVRSLPDFRYVGTIRDTKTNSGPITSVSFEEVDSRMRFVTGGAQLRIWDQVRRARKRRGSSEDVSLIPCKFICKYTEAKESEPESDSESESPANSKETSVEGEEPRQSYCVIL